MVELLASISGARGRFELVARQTALWPDGVDAPYFEQMLFRVGNGWVDTPAGSLEMAPAGYVTFSAEYFEEIELHADGPVRTLLAVSNVDQLLACIGDAERLTLELYGGPDDRFATEMQVVAGDTTVQFDRLPDASYVADVPEQMPETFADDRFHLEDGTAAPTIVETTTGALSRVVEAVDAIDGSSYPLVLSEQGPTLDVARRGVVARSKLSGCHVEGPTVHNLYGDAFARAIRTLDGPVRLETAPNGPVAIIQESETYTSRVVVPGR